MVIAVVAISFAAIFFRKTQPTHPLVAAGLRLAIASIILSPWVLRARRRGSLGPRVIRLATLGGLFYGVHFGAWVTSLTLTSVISSVTLVTATPLLLGIAALVMGKDQPRPRHWVAIAGAVAGLAIISQHDLGVSVDALVGDGLALVGAAAMAAYLLVSRRLGEALEPLPFTGVAVTVGAVILLGSAWLVGVPIEASSTEALVYIGLAALVPQLIGHSLLTWAVRHVRPMIVGMATVGEPVGAAILASLWPGIEESIGPQVAIGCAVTLASVVLALWQPADTLDR